MTKLHFVTVMASIAEAAHIAIALGIIVMVTPRAGAQGPDDPALTKRFLQEAPSRWAEYRHRIQRVQGQFAFHIEGTESKNDPQGTKYNTQAGNNYDYKFNENCMLILTSRTRMTTFNPRKNNYDTHEVFGVNPRYAFQLKRKSPTAPWVVVGIAPVQNGDVPEDWKHAFSEFSTEGYMLVALEYIPLEEWVRNPTFRVLSSRAVQKAGEELVEVNFECQADRVSRDIKGGKFVLDPRRYWGVRSSEVRIEGKGYRGTARFEILEMADLDESPPFPKHTLRETNFVSDNGDKTHGVQRHDLNLEVPHHLPDESEFTLSAFGFPEPPGLERPSIFRRIPIYYWVAGLGVVILILGIAARRLILKRTGAPATPT